VNVPDANQARALAERFLMTTYRRPEVVFTRGDGCRLFDSQGKPYLDFLGGIAVNALGHAHPRMVRVIAEQAARAIHLSNLYHNEFQGPLAEKLAQWSGMDRVFFTNSGTEAIEGALKLARLHARKLRGDAAEAGELPFGFLALEHSFHGRTFGALSITHAAKYRQPYAPLVPGAAFVRFNDVADLEAKVDETVCAVVIEPVQGEGGIRCVSETFWGRARELCTKHNAALIADEIQCGLGRTGRAFAYQRFAAKPDVVVVAKPLAGGLPLGAILASEEFASAFTPGLHGTTFGGGPLACAAALEFLRIVEDEDLMANARARGEEIISGLEKLKSRFSFITEVRGEGLILGLELSIEGARLVDSALAKGLLINCTHERILRFLPPLNISAAHVKEFLEILESVLAEAQPAGGQAGTAAAATNSTR
jgi:acetylornithine aminotransferase/acetylornithine/N-succinyldiaminopimelate aminotransferase